jgi:hypothetical protein
MFYRFSMKYQKKAVYITDASTKLFFCFNSFANMLYFIMISSVKMNTCCHI